MNHLTEDNRQIMVMEWVKLIKYKHKTLADYLHHSPNGGKRHVAIAVRLKKWEFNVVIPI